MRLNFLSSIFLVSALSLNSCDSSSSNTNSRIVDSSLSDRAIQVGQSSVLSLGLTYNQANLPFSGSHDVSLIVRLPSTVRFREGTAEIQRIISDKVVTPIITNCTSSGEQFLDFRLDGDDLSNAKDPSGLADVEIRLTIDAVKSSGIQVIEAIADKDTPLFSCGESFPNDIEESIQVVQ